MSLSHRSKYDGDGVLNIFVCRPMHALYSTWGPWSPKAWLLYAIIVTLTKMWKGTVDNVITSLANTSNPLPLHTHNSLPVQPLFSVTHGLLLFHVIYRIFSKALVKPLGTWKEESANLEIHMLLPWPPMHWLLQRNQTRAFFTSSVLMVSHQLKGKHQPFSKILKSTPGYADRIHVHFLSTLAHAPLSFTSSECFTGWYVLTVTNAC